MTARAGTITLAGTATLGHDDNAEVFTFAVPVMFNAHLTTDTNGQPVVQVVAPSLEPRIRKACEAFIEAFNTTNE